MGVGRESVDVCEEAVKRRKSSVQRAEAGGFAVMARLENHRNVAVALLHVLQKAIILVQFCWLLFNNADHKLLEDCSLFCSVV